MAEYNSKRIIKGFEEDFEEGDTDGDGKISLGEFLLMVDKGSGEKCEQMKVKELLTMFRSIDTNNSGGINF